MPTPNIPANSFAIDFDKQPKKETGLISITRQKGNQFQMSINIQLTADEVNDTDKEQEPTTITGDFAAFSVEPNQLSKTTFPASFRFSYSGDAIVLHIMEPFEFSIETNGKKGKSGGGF